MRRCADSLGGRAPVLVAVLMLLAPQSTRLTGLATPAENPRSGVPQYEQDVRPILEARCMACHGDSSPAAGLNLTTLSSIQKGSKNGPVIVHGASQNSNLFQKISSKSMPPPGAPPLSEEQIQTIRKWIDDGQFTEASAEEPPTERPDGTEKAEITEKDRQFWSFQPTKSFSIPKPKALSRVQTPVDAFILAKLEAKRLSFSPEASKVQLMRRAYFDLTGLPPSRDEAREFLADKRPGAYERLLDRLLASPHYGERWGRYWLDVAGYTDESGLGNNLTPVSLSEGLWRYRDYVVQSFNADKPYDRFLTEQLAGDEMVDWVQAEKYSAGILEPLIATGFLRTVTDITFEGPNNNPRQRFATLFRVVDNFSAGVLGLTVGCARCHDHKYDPISQKDYYRLASLFAPAYNPYHWKTPENRFLPDLSKSELDETERHNGEIRGRLDELTKQLAILRGPYEKRLFESKLSAAGIPAVLLADVKAAFQAPAKGRNRDQQYLFRKFRPVLEVSQQEVVDALEPRDKLADAKLQEQVTLLKSWIRPTGKIQALWDVGAPPEVRLFYRGNLETPGPKVEAGFLAALSAPDRLTVNRHEQTQGNTSGFRLALAKWLTSKRHPLTARVFVNRVWLHHFGKGLVSTPANFGRMGAAPTHPELLDWLAVDFMENGWKLKKLHKLLMMSSAYRQSSQRPSTPEASLGEKVDPANDLLWRMNIRRLDAEAIRDAMLQVSGTLDSGLGGPPIALDSDKNGLVTVSENDGIAPNRLRRSLYLVARRNYSLSFLDVFDFPIMTLNCTQRSNSATPLQSLTLLNSEFVMQRAKDFAARLLGSRLPIQRMIQIAYESALARNPDQKEMQLSLAYVEQQKRLYLDVKSSPERALQSAMNHLCHMLIASNEFLYID